MTVASFEVGAVFRIINEASPALAKILAQIRELNLAMTKARESMAGFSSSLGLGAAVGETNALARAWTGVAEASAIATGNLNRATAASRRAAAGAGGGAVGGGRGMLGGQLGMGGHGGHFGTPAMAGLGLAAYAGYQAMKFEDAAALMATHAGVDYKENRDKFEKVLKDATSYTGFDERSVSLAAQQELRMFSDTGGDNGVGILPKMLRYAAVEARRKGTTLEESMTALVGLAHMTQSYSSEDVDKIAPAFSVLSTRNPMSLSAQERAFGYAVPILHSALGLDPLEVMAASTGLARAGITSTKAGTWIRSMMTNAMPGTSFMSKFAFKKHEGALKELGLVDDKDNPTWFVDGKPSMTKFLEVAGDNLQHVPMSRRSGLMKSLMGQQGEGALAVLSEPKVREQIPRMYKEATDPRNINDVRSWMEHYSEQSTLQNARQSFQTFNNLMADVGDHALPSVNRGLTEFKSIADQIRGVTPTPSVDKKWGIGTTALEGAGIGAGVGLFAGGIGALPGAGIGLATGAVAAAVHDFMQAASDLKRTASVFPGGTRPVPTPTPSVSIILDGQLLGKSVANSIATDSVFSTGAPAADAMDSYTGGEHHQMDH